MQQTYDIYTINIPEGWSGLSSYLMPADTDIENIFGDILDELVIAVTGGEFFYPFYNINTIGNWEQHSAYKVKTNAEVNLNIIGAMEEDKTVSLDNGWNMMPVVSECPVDVETLFAPVVSDLEIVKDVAGWGIYWPGMGINTLGALISGKAYYVLVSSAVEVTFEECVKAALINLTGFENLSGLAPWGLTRPTPSSHSIAIKPEAVKGFEEGSIIGAFNQAGQCFGVVVLNTETLCLTTFGDDPISTQTDGFEQGEQMIIRLFKPSTNEEFVLIPEFDPDLPFANGTFAENGISVITGFKVSGTGMSGDFANEITLYPNPATGRFMIMGIDESAVIEIFDIQGQLIHGEISKTKQGKEVNLSGMQPGIYLVKVNQNGHIIYKKLILK